jgi:predicted RNA-binding protein with PUA domain
VKIDEAQGMKLNIPFVEKACKYPTMWVDELRFTPNGNLRIIPAQEEFQRIIEP